ncbi:hypothetical protein H8356DRAFT_1361889 [Neocallimastix lanati (nom. inval.)]|nr:hypothetical protein H8356DRAFT_1361889 [Neocallimastix sp. JGI-2020a]
MDIVSKLRLKGFILFAYFVGMMLIFIDGYNKYTSKPHITSTDYYNRYRNNSTQAPYDNNNNTNNTIVDNSIIQNTTNIKKYYLIKNELATDDLF